jgi:crotonobetainyl-CoA:carnitine CoA-transferase CaiB-like acyl-CoA transferase
VASPTRASVELPLTGLGVIDCSVSLPASFCTSLLQRLGASVTSIEDVSEPTQTKSAFLDEHLSRVDVYREYVTRQKEVIRVDLGSARGKASLERVLDDADVLVEDWRHGLIDTMGLDLAALVKRNPRLIVASVTPYGRTGPRSGASASDLTLFHGAGPGHATPGLVEDPETMPPLRLGSHQGSFLSGVAAAINVCAAVLQRKRATDTGPVGVNFSCHEAVANSFRQSLGTFAFYGGGLSRDLARGRGAGGTAEHRNIRCRDGWINMAWAGVLHWDCVGDLLGQPSWMEDDRLATPAARYKNWALVIPHLEAWALEHDKEEIFYLCQGHRIPCAPVNEGLDLLSAGVLASRSFWEDSTETGAVLPGVLSQFRHADE